MTLPADVARCPGFERDGEWREGCEDCMRRTSPSDHPHQVWIEPPPIITFECEFRIEPIAELLAGDTGRGAAMSGKSPLQKEPDLGND